MDCPQQSLPISFAVAAFVELLQQAVESLQIGTTLLDEDCHQGRIFLRRYQRQRLGFDLLLLRLFRRLLLLRLTVEQRIDSGGMGGHLRIGFTATLQLLQQSRQQCDALANDGNDFGRSLSRAIDHFVQQFLVQPGEFACHFGAHQPGAAF